MWSLEERRDENGKSYIAACKSLQNYCHEVINPLTLEMDI